jgi:hypothetical protein
MHEDGPKITALLDELKDRAAAIASGRFDDGQQETAAGNILETIGRLRVVLARHDLVQPRRSR